MMREEEDPVGDSEPEGNGSADDDSDEEDASVEQPIRTRVLGPDSRLRMDLSPLERQWALDIKDMVVNTPELDNCSDFFYAQLALVDRGDIEASVARVLKLQMFRQECGILDTYESTKHDVCEFLLLHPKWLLNFSFDSETGGYVAALDFLSFHIDRVRANVKGQEIMVKGMYAWSHVFSPDFEAIRRGTTILMECEGYSKGVGMDLKSFRLHWDIIQAYPIKLEAVKHFHTGVFVNLLVSMGKRFLSREIANKFQVGCLAPERLDKLFHVPDYPTALQHNLCRVDESLRRRYHNEASFSL